MKRLTATFNDDAVIDLTAIAAIAVSVQLETISSEPAPAPRKVNRVHGKTLESVVMSHYSPSGGFLTSQAEAWIKKEGYAPQSTSPALSKLVASKHIERAGKDRFRFLKPMGA